MLTIRTSKDFDRDYKKVKLISALVEVLHGLLNEQPLPPEYKDHDLIGNWKGYRECHIKPDLLLVYKLKDGELLLARLNSHSNIFG